VRRDTIVFAAGGAVVGVLLLVICFAKRKEEDTLAPLAWCAPGLEPIAGGGCFAGSRAQGGSLIVYLHGRYSNETAPQEMARQSRVARMANARGFSVLALRGRQGQCSAPEFAEYFCFPSNERNQEAGAPTVASWAEALAEAEARAGRTPRYLLGFSNGGYFATLIATRALMDFDAIAIAGAGPVEPTRAHGAKKPILLITADEDVSATSMMQLDDELTRESWPHAIVTRDGGHELLESDIDAALTFFVRLRTEKLPFSVPMSTRRPQPKTVAEDTTEEEDDH